MSITLQELDKATCQPMGPVYLCQSMDEARSKAMQLRITNYAIKHLLPEYPSPHGIKRSPSITDIKKLVEGQNG